LNRSQGNPEERGKKVYTEISEINEGKIGEEVIIRARAHGVTGKGSIAFVILR